MYNIYETIHENWQRKKEGIVNPRIWFIVRGRRYANASWNPGVLIFTAMVQKILKILNEKGPEGLLPQNLNEEDLNELCDLITKAQKTILKEGKILDYLFVTSIDSISKIILIIIKAFLENIQGEEIQINDISLDTFKNGYR